MKPFSETTPDLLENFMLRTRAALLSLVFFIVWLGPAIWMAGFAEERNTSISDWKQLSPNQWNLIQREEPLESNTFNTVRLEEKVFAQAVMAQDFDRLYLWGVGGKMRSRSSFDRYELESFSLEPKAQKWTEALPLSKATEWANRKWPLFQLHGIEGTDGPRIMLVGTGLPNVVRFLHEEEIARPSPIYTFNQACYDSTRKRIVYFGGGKTLALDPATNTWTDLNPKNRPLACDSLTWGSLCYDPVNEEILLFGGGLAFNPEGGARTWLYDCKKETWYRPATLGVEPPLRCTSPIVFDPTTKSMVLFGGYDQAAALNDTWIYRCDTRRWEQRSPKVSPPPMFMLASAALPEGRIVICGSNAMLGKRTHSETFDPKETWLYDVSENTWQPIGTMKLPCRWLSATSSAKSGVAFLVSASSAGRQTFAFRYDKKAAELEPMAAAKMPGAPPGTTWFKYDEQRESLLSAPKPDQAAQRRFLANLPTNEFVDAAPPGLVVSKTCSGAAIDTERGEVIYTGGGHSGYTGNDVATYSIAENRWSLDAPPRFPPFLESTNASVYGLSYGARPWSQHTYLWYSYDPISKKVIYCARPVIRDGETVLLDPDPAKAFTFDKKEHGHWTWVFDPATRELSLPSFGRMFDNPWELCLTATPRGVFACTKAGLYHATVQGNAVAWRSLGGPVPAPKGAKYNYEWMPIVYDSKRERLIHLMGNEEAIEVHVRGLTDASWSEFSTKGHAVVGRELAYLPKSDSLLLLSRDRLFTLDLETSAWRELDVAMPKGTYGTEATMVYDPQHDLSVLLLPKNFNGPLQTYFFRFDPKSAQYKSDPGTP